jgi:formylglycine-generating enzyme required for sulfatase activity
MPAQIMPAGIYPLTPEREQALRPKDSFKECDACPEMVVVPKGSFIMGTPITEVDRFKGEDPLHRVTLARPFAVGRFTVSFDEWDACRRRRLRRQQG